MSGRPDGRRAGQHQQGTVLARPGGGRRRGAAALVRRRRRAGEGTNARRAEVVREQLERRVATERRERARRKARRVADSRHGPAGRDSRRAAGRRQGLFVRPGPVADGTSRVVRPRREGNENENENARKRKRDGSLERLRDALRARVFSIRIRQRLFPRSNRGVYRRGGGPGPGPGPVPVRRDSRDRSGARRRRRRVVRGREGMGPYLARDAERRDRRRVGGRV